MRSTLTIVAALACVTRLHAQSRDPDLRRGAKGPVVSYVIRASATDTAGYDVEMHIRGLSDTSRLVMAVHPEYDDRFWRYVRDLRAEGEQAPAALVREDSARWKLTLPGGSGTVRWRIALPPMTGPYRSAWRPFLRPSGGLVGGTQSFLYVRGKTEIPAHVRLDIPAGWLIATGLEATVDPRTFWAASVATLLDSPLLIGNFQQWWFEESGVPHRIAYWPSPGGMPIDSIALLDIIRKIAHGAAQITGRVPYPDYTFLLQDGAQGGLEHRRSVTIGVIAQNFARNPVGYAQTIAHEYFHTWNLVRVRPRGREIDVTDLPPTHSPTLWWAEGATIFFADEILRREGLIKPASSRIERLRGQIERYLGDAGNSHVSPEQASRASDSPPGSNGDYEADVYLQGDLFASLLDLHIRDSTNLTRGVDDVMRVLFGHFAGQGGYVTADVAQAASDACGCSLGTYVTSFAQGNRRPLDIDRALASIGLRTRFTRAPATNDSGKPEPDMRFWARPGQPGGVLLVSIPDPASAWARSGTHSGDTLVSLNGHPTPSQLEMRRELRAGKLGDTMTVVVRRGQLRTLRVPLGAYEKLSVTLTDLPSITDRQRKLRAAWESPR